MVVVVATALFAVGMAAQALAHGDHPKCKKGYVVNDAHKCVKAKS